MAMDCSSQNVPGGLSSSARTSPCPPLYLQIILIIIVKFGGEVLPTVGASIRINNHNVEVFAIGDVVFQERTEQKQTTNAYIAKIIAKPQPECHLLLCKLGVLSILYLSY